MSITCGIKTFGEDLQRVRAGNHPSAYAAIRNLAIGAFRRAGYANVAHARRYYGRDDQRILAPTDTPETPELARISARVG